MRILLYTDNHFSEFSSIIRSQGSLYSIRLENQIQSLNWVQKKSIEEECDAIICLGDFFDKPTLNDKELTALNNIEWNKNIPNYFLVGNHESSVNGLAYSSTEALKGENRFILNEYSSFTDDCNTTIHFLPYIIESDRKELSTYINLKQENINSKNIILSHNDIKGIQMGPFISKTGFTIEDIENNCDLFINGHLHNGMKITNKIINLGNLTGQNFSEDALRYEHKIMILDTHTLEYKYITNPYAFNFYKLEINNENDLKILANLKSNSVLSIKCNEEYIDKLKERLEDIKDYLVETRITLTRTTVPSHTENSLTENISTNYLDKFIEFCNANIDNTDILQFELSEVCK